MTIKEAIESYKRNIDYCKRRLEIDRLRMEPAEIKEMRYYIERDELAIRSLKEWKNSNIDLYIRDKESGRVHRIGHDRHDHLTITPEGELRYENLQNGDGCILGSDAGGL